MNPSSSILSLFPDANSRIARVGVDFSKLKKGGTPEVFLENEEQQPLGVYDNPNNEGIWSRNLCEILKILYPEPNTYKNVHVPVPEGSAKSTSILPENIEEETSMDLPVEFFKII